MPSYIFLNEPKLIDCKIMTLQLNFIIINYCRSTFGSAREMEIKKCTIQLLGVAFFGKLFLLNFKQVTTSAMNVLTCRYKTLTEYSNGCCTKNVMFTLFCLFGSMSLCGILKITFFKVYMQMLTFLPFLVNLSSRARISNPFTKIRYFFSFPDIDS